MLHPQYLLAFQSRMAKRREMSVSDPDEVDSGCFGTCFGLASDASCNGSVTRSGNSEAVIEKYTLLWFDHSFTTEKQEKRTRKRGKGVKALFG